MAELLPCPFCGGEAFMYLGEFPTKSVRQKKEMPKGAKLVRKSTHRHFETAEQAEEAWNRRTPNDERTVVGNP